MRPHATISLSEAVEFINGDRGTNYPDRDAQKPTGHCLFLNTKNVRQGYFDFSETAFIDKERHRRLGGGTLIRNDIVVTIRGTLGNTAIYREDVPFEVVRINSAMLALRPRGHFDPDFIERYLRSSEFLDWVGSNQRGSAQPHLRTADIETAQLPLLSLRQQRRIVAKIDSLTGKSRRARDHLDHIPRLVEKYKQAVLAAAFRGDLTRDWRERHSSKWRIVSIGDVALTLFDGPFGSNLKSSDYTDQGIRVVRLENIGHLTFVKEKQTFISEEKYNGLKRHTLRPNDILVSSFVADEMRVCLFPPDLDTQAINKADCFCLRPNTELVLPRFVELRLASSETFHALEEDVHGATRPRISLSQLRQLSLRIPSLEEQAEIVSRVETAFIWIDRLASEARSARRFVDRLDQTVLAKAFQGELVPQNADDERASVLLGRIRTERGAAPKAKRGRKAKAA